MKVWLAYVLVIMTAGNIAYGDTTARDGDTIVVAGTPVRLEGLHCPELGELYGEAAKTLMRQVLGASTITCQLSGKRSHDREIGYCQANGFDLGSIMIKSGYCQPCRRYDRLGLYEELPVTEPVPNYCR